MSRQSSKAAAAELEALGRHLGKGMPLAEWVPEHIPGHVMAMIAEDLGDGTCRPAYAVKSAAALLPEAAPQQNQAVRGARPRRSWRPRFRPG